MKASRTVTAIVGIVVLVLGLVFALQGAGAIGGSALMSGNSTYVYVGGIVAVVGLLILLMASRERTDSSSSVRPPDASVTS